MDLREKVSNSSKKTLTTGVILLFSVLLLAGVGYSQVSGSGDIVLDPNEGIILNTGTLDVNGNDIEDAGTTIWDQSAGQVATSVVDYTAATASDVGLGNVENVALSNAVWSDLGISQSDISASDVGLGNVQNEAQVAESGDTMTGSLFMSGYDLEEVADIEVGVASGGGGEIASISQRSEDSIIINSHEDVELEADENGNDGGPYTCTLDQSTSEFNCDVTKNWVHDLENGSEAYYSSQESPQVRAVYEGRTTVNDGSVNVSLPRHFSMTVSDSKPMLRAQATPHELATVAVTERTDDYLVIESSKAVKVDYRITGIREGYEHKQVVRQKEK